MAHTDVNTMEFKAGQKFATPSPGFGDRVFYETLLVQRPDSEMAQDWCLAYGVLEAEEAKKLYDKVTKRKSGNNGKSKGSPVKKPVNVSSSQTSSSSNGKGSSVSSSKAAAAAPPTKKRKVTVDSDDED